MATSSDWPVTQTVSLRLSTAQRSALQITWACMYGNSAAKLRTTAIVERCFAASLETDARLKLVCLQTAVVELLNEGDLAVCSRKCDRSLGLLPLIDKLLRETRSQITCGDVLGVFIKIGGRHSALRTFGFSVDLWRVWGDCLLAVLSRQACVRICPAARRAWSSLVNSVVSALCAGFETACQSADAHSRVIDVPPRTDTPAGKRRPASEQTRRRVATRRAESTVSDASDEGADCLVCRALSDRALHASLSSMRRSPSNHRGRCYSSGRRSPVNFNGALPLAIGQRRQEIRLSGLQLYAQLSAGFDEFFV